MKILIIFVDMLRANLLNTFDSNNKVTAIDKVLQNWGGTAFTNCFTPGPDTPRSNGCLWSGLYPKNNGCNIRLKYPAFFLNDKRPTFLDILYKNGYSLNFYANKWTIDIGEFPKANINKYILGKENLLEEQLKNTKVEENSLHYFCIDDFHYNITDTDAQEKWLDNGYNKTAKAMNVIDKYLNINSFDLVFCYSDHGFKKFNEKFKNNILKQLDRDRTQITMFIHQKGDTELTTNNKLCSILDVFPTVCEACNMQTPKNIEGISLISKNEHETLILEDHKTFTADMSQTIEMWGVVNKEGIAAVDCNKNWTAEYSLSHQQKQHFEQLLTEKGSFFAENTKMQEVRNYYSIVEQACPIFHDGELRKKHLSKTILLKSKIKKYINL